MPERERLRGGSAPAGGPLSVEEVAERAARLGITLERVLREIANIAFADLRRIVEWDEKGMKFRADADDDLVAIIEIVAAAGSGRPYRIKLHDKRPALDALGRAVGLFPKAAIVPDADENEGDAQSARERLIAELDRLAAEQEQAGSAAKPER